MVNIQVPTIQSSTILPPTPPIVHILYKIQKIELAVTARAQEAAETPMKFPRNDVLAELHCILGNCAQLVKAEQADAAARNESPSTEPIRVSIICAGGNATLSEILAAHCFLVEQDPHLLTSVEIRYYILPTEGVNDLANYIATCDAWYHRNVWTVTSHPQLLVPWLSRSDPQWGKV